MVGMAQAEKLQERLASEPIREIYSSDLKRALHTAEVIASSHQADVIPRPELREIDFGQFEGMTFAEIQRLYPEAAKLWTRKNIGSNPELGFPGGESLHTLATRVASFITKLTRTETSDTVLVVGHGGPLRIIVCQLLGLELSHWWQIQLNPASLTVVETYPEGGVLCLLNDVCHLAMP